VAHGGLARRALEKERLVRKAHRVTVQQVDFHLRGAGFVNQRVDLDVLGFAERVHVVEQRIELVHGRDAVRLSADLRAPGTAHRRLQRIVRIDVGFYQEELEFRRDHRLPTVRFIEFQNPPQHIARRHGDWPAVAVEAIMDHLRGGFCRPWHHSHRLRVRLEDNVDVRRIHGTLVVRVVARDGLQKKLPPAAACPPLPRISPRA